MKARAILTDLDKYKSDCERAFAQFGIPLIEDKFDAGVELMLYEPVTFNLPGNKYTPDFQVILEDGCILFVEIKGNRRQRNYRDARSKLRAAQAVHPYYIWIEVRMSVSRGQITRFEMEVIE